ncbi:sigma-70 family RNA polymerase sigma factor [Paenibacillus antri]|uniref:Sigma-70 family RNA polymerase sigma factor n=1 Tax=Paenibacillus antri TaxID=2582848 RepID=A0A5R9GIY2_9BACL|nr:RNA polymerase sigma factor SigJ [Paenibacillus antri]TLS53424.1 sigma-70 family RNA polymerase sigma factor [Paenibacillus antri]
MQELYVQYKGLMFKLAYQLTGSAADAEDVVHDVFLKAQSLPPSRLEDSKAFLCKMVTNRCRDLYKSARKKREHYVGEWLPEPLQGAAEDSSESVVQDDLLSYAMLVLLERLSISERAVFVLREALGFEYGEVAKLLGKSEVGCRKLFSRAKAKMELPEDEPIRSDPAGRSWADDFVAALKKGDLDRLYALLDQDVVLVADGGGKAVAALNPIRTRERVAQFLLGGVRKAATVGDDVVIDLVRLNGQAGFVIRSEEGIVHTAGMFRIAKDGIRNIYLMRNPDKLTYVGK